jgi:hypothetical protein
VADAMITWPVFASIAMTDHVANAGEAISANARVQISVFITCGPA